MLASQTLPRPRAKASEPSTDYPKDAARIARVKKTKNEIDSQAENFKKITQDLHPITKVLEKLVDNHRYLSKIILLGCGDSWFTGLGVRYAFENLLHIPCEVFQALEYAQYYFSTTCSNTLVIGQSSGGNTPAVMNALKKAQEQGAYVIGMSNKDFSPVLTSYDDGIYIPVLRQGWPTQASTISMGVLTVFACLLAKKTQANTQLADLLLKEICEIPSKMEKAIKENESLCKKVATELKTYSYFQLTGGGPNYASALFGAAKLKELCPVHANAFPVEEFHHYRTLKKDDVILLFSANNNMSERELETALVGEYDDGIILNISEDESSAIAKHSRYTFVIPKCSEYVSAMLYWIPIQLFAYHLACCKYESNIGYPSLNKVQEFSDV